MKSIPLGKMLEATRLTKVGNLMDATAALQRMLSSAPDKIDDGTLTIDHAPPAEARSEPAGGRLDKLGAALRSALPDGLREFIARTGAADSIAPHSEPGGSKGSSGGEFLTATFSNHAGSRNYKLYIPTSYRGQPVPLIIMLHGCTQSPDDFAAGTRMNLAAEENACLVAYPAQTSAANMQKCWNWFNEADQQRDRGEPAVIAGITRKIMRDYAIDPSRVYVAGLSAGGATTAIMGDAYPDLYAAIGIHSGLASGSARDMSSAFTAMQRGAENKSAERQRDPRQGKQRRTPAIIFHGDRDTTVNQVNGDDIATEAARDAFAKQIERGTAGGLGYRRTRHLDRSGAALVEYWEIEGGGHAWFGGSPTGSYTDPRGPDATREMMRFFLAHEHENPA